MNQWLNNFERGMEIRMRRTPALQKLVGIVFCAFLFFLVAFAAQSLVSEELESRRVRVSSEISQVLGEVKVAPELMDEVILELEAEPDLPIKDRLLLDELKSFRKR